MNAKYAGITAGLVLAIYIVSYVILSLRGEYVEPVAHAVIGVDGVYELQVWQPKYVTRLSFFSEATGERLTRGNALGTLYAPLIAIDAVIWHRTIGFDVIDMGPAAPHDGVEGVDPEPPMDE